MQGALRPWRLDEQRTFTRHVVTNDIRAVLALSGLPRVGRARLRAILQCIRERGLTPSLTVRHALDECAGDSKLPRFSDADNDRAAARADDISEHCERLGIVVRPYGWPEYPRQLKRIADPPALLFSIGAFKSSHAPRVAVIGTRHPSQWGLRTVAACARQIAERGGVVVSGLALGIDAAAHTASVDKAGETWAVMAHGLHMVAPSSNRVLAEQILDKGGALISEYPPGENTRRHYFVERDRIQAGLSDAVLVIESGISGGAMHTVRAAQKVNIPVWVTFPNESASQGASQTDDLPEPQQGTWDLLHSQEAAHISTPGVLASKLAALAALSDTPAPP